MKNLLIILIFTVLTVNSYAQSPYLIYDNPNYNEKFSNFFNMGDKAIISYNSQHHDYSANNHVSFCNQFIFTKDGIVSNNTLIDSNDYTGFGVLISSYVKKNNRIYQFGALLGNKATNYRFLIRKTTNNLSLVKDTVIDFNNSLLGVSDAIVDSNTFLVSGSSYDGNSTYGFVFRIDSTLNIIDSVFFPLGSAYYLDYGFVKINNKPQLKITFGEAGLDIVLRLNDYPLSIEDTLYSSINGPYEFYPNSFPTYISDSTYITPISVLAGEGTDSSYNTIGWIKWDSVSNIIDTVLPLRYVVSSDFKARYKSIYKSSQDSIIMGFSHGAYIFSPKVLSRQVGIVFSDIDGNISKRLFYGGDYYYTLENIFRFDNGNIVLLAYRQSTPWKNDPSGFVLWLIDKSGNVIQTIEKPIANRLNVITYPNPTITQLNITLKSPHKSIRQLQVTDLQGKKILQKQINAKQTKLDVSNLSKGVYILEGLTNTGESFSRKFVKE